MASKSTSGGGLNWFFKGAFVNFTVLMVYCMFHPMEMTQIIKTENTEHVLLIGEEAYAAVQERGMTWYKDAVEDTGLRVWVVKWFGHSLDKPTWKLRLTVMFNAIQQFFIRWALISAWAPIGLLAALAFWVDGIARWKARKFSFAYPSPRTHTWCKRTVYAVPVMLMTVASIPMHLPSAIIPFVFLLLAIALNASAANMAKKL